MLSPPVQVEHKIQRPHALHPELLPGTQALIHTPNDLCSPGKNSLPPGPLQGNQDSIFLISISSP